MNTKQIKIYKNIRGKSPFLEWFNSLDKKHRELISARIDRIFEGNLGDYKQIDTDIFELKLHFSSGYRIYFAQDGKIIIILLCGGDKSSQSRDILKAKNFYNDYKENIK